MTQAVSALRFAPALPLWLLAVLAAACILAAGAGHWRRARGAWWRSAAFAVLLAWLAGPTLVQETRQGLSDIALLVTDASASMQVGDRAALAAKAAASLTTQAAHMPGLELRHVTVPESGHDGTLLWAGVRQALADIPADRLAGIVAITDGQVHDLPADPATIPAPLNVLIPAQGEEWDRRVRVIEAPGYGIVGRTLMLRVAVEDLGPPGAAPAGPATLSVQVDGQPSDHMQVTPGEVQSVPVDITREGRTLVKLSTDAVPGEASPLNNQTVVEINGVRDRLRVLLVSGEPNQGERTWRRLLKSDPAVDLVHFTILRPPEKDDTTPLNELALIAFPTRELFQDKLSGFDLIILDRFTDRGILPHIYLRNIADYVRHGGALLLVAGPEFAGGRSLDQTPLGDVLPAHAPQGADTRDDADQGGAGLATGAFTPLVTELGTRHPVTQGLAADPNAPGWGAWYRAIKPEDVTGQVLDDRAEQGAAADPEPCGPGPRRHADERPDLAVVTRPIVLAGRRRRPAGGAAAPRRALADEGAGPGRGTPDRPHPGRPLAGGAPIRLRQRRRHRDGHAAGGGHAAAWCWRPPAPAAQWPAWMPRHPACGRSATGHAWPTPR